MLRLLRLLDVRLPMMNIRVPEAGETLAGKYYLHRMLGRGGVGVVYEGEHLRLRQRVAIKILAPEMLHHREMVERFEREARAMALLQSPRITRVTDVDFTPEGVPYLVMEFLHGHDLQSELKARGALPTAEAVHWVREACAGMAIVHDAGIVHRDLKPANLFILEGEPRMLKIMDFGISKIVGEDFEMTTTQATLGTPAYMAPEQVRSARNIDVRADVWSLGVILYRALSGKLPFTGAGSTGMAVSIVNDPPIPLQHLRPDLPPALIAIVNRTLDKNPEGRFPSVRALSDALAPFESAVTTMPSVVAETTNDAQASIAGQSLINEPRARKRWWPIAIPFLVLSAAAGVFVATRGAPTNEPTTAPEPKKPASKPEPKPTEEITAPPPPIETVAPSSSPSVVAPKPKPPTISKPVESATPPPKKPPPPAGSMPVLL